VPIYRKILGYYTVNNNHVYIDGWWVEDGG